MGEQGAESLHTRLHSNELDRLKHIFYMYNISTWDQLTYTAPEVENLKRSFPSGYAYETRACEVGDVQNAHFTVASSWRFF